MKKTAKIIVVVVLLFTLCLGILTACDKPIDHDEAFALLKKNYENAIKYDIFYSKELISDNVNKEITRVNSVCTANNKNEYVKNADGTYKDHAVNVYYEKNNVKQMEIFVGLSKDGKKDQGKYLQFITKFISKDKYSNEYKSMTPAEYVKSQEFAQYSLANKFAEIGLMERDDIQFFEKDGALRTGEMTTIKFKLNQGYYDKFLASYGKESLLKGTYITIELLYGRIGNITVMQEEAGTESIFGISEYERYKLEVVYLGPIIKNMPNYNAVDTNNQKIWTEIK